MIVYKQWLSTRGESYEVQPLTFLGYVKKNGGSNTKFMLGGKEYRCGLWKVRHNDKIEKVKVRVPVEDVIVGNRLNFTPIQQVEWNNDPNPLTDSYEDCIAWENDDEYNSVYAPHTGVRVFLNKELENFKVKLEDFISRLSNHTTGEYGKLAKLRIKIAKKPRFEDVMIWNKSNLEDRKALNNLVNA